jgi:hypothetical protein
MPTNKLHVRFYGIRVPYGSTSRSDKVVAVDSSKSFAGMLEVFEVFHETQGAVHTISTSMVLKFGGTSTSPVLLTKLEVLNPNASPATFKIALMTTPTGTPGVIHAFLGWDTSIAVNSVFSWTGSVPLIDRYVYAQASIAGLLLYRDLQFITA